MVKKTLKFISLVVKQHKNKVADKKAAKKAVMIKKVGDMKKSNQ